MKVKVAGLNKRELLIGIDLVSSNNKVCLHTQVRAVRNGSYIAIFYYPPASTRTLSTYDDLKKTKRILVNNIGKIIDKIFGLFNYDKNEIKSIEFMEGSTVFVTLNRWVKKEEWSGASDEKKAYWESLQSHKQAEEKIQN